MMSSESTLACITHTGTYRYLDYGNITAKPLHRFASGGSYSNITVDSLVLSGAQSSISQIAALHSDATRKTPSGAIGPVTLKSTITLTATVTNHGPVSHRIVLSALILICPKMQREQRACF